MMMTGVPLAAFAGEFPPPSFPSLNLAILYERPDVRKHYMAKLKLYRRPADPPVLALLRRMRNWIPGASGRCSCVEMSQALIYPY
eukprot:6770086-Pyramimonas_sp.AAC.1